MISSLSKYPGPGLVMVVLVNLMLVACEEPLPEQKEIVRPVKLMKLDMGGTGATLEYPGKVEATQTVELSFEVSGKIVELPIENGLAVKRRALLGRLDNTDYLAARDLAEAQRKAAQSAYERSKRIFDQGAGSQADVDARLRDIDVAKQELKKAQKALNDTDLKAPFAGQVSRKIAENFQNVQAKQPILLLEDLSSLELDVNVPERDFSRMKPGLTLEQRNERATPEIEVSTIPGRRFPATLISFETTADPVTRTYLATFAFDNPTDVNVLPGMTAKVVLNLPGDVANEAFGGIWVPTTAIVVDTDGTAYAWRYNPKSSKVTRTSVTLGEMSAASIQILRGLEDGDHIAVSGAAHLIEGMKVRPLGE